MSKKVILLSPLFLFLLLVGPAPAQNVAGNGDLELQAPGSWDEVGGTQGTEILLYDTNGNGSDSWCWKRTPGSNPSLSSGDGGFTQQVSLIAGTTYTLTASIAYLADC
jgi:hypothetical protein